MKTHRLGLLFVPMPKGQVGTPIAHVIVESSFRHEYLGVPQDVTLLTPREHGIVGLEQQVAILKQDLDNVLSSARRKYANWERRERKGREQK